MRRQPPGSSAQQVVRGDHQVMAALLASLRAALAAGADVSGMDSEPVTVRHGITLLLHQLQSEASATPPCKDKVILLNFIKFSSDLRNGLLFGADMQPIRRALEEHGCSTVLASGAMVFVWPAQYKSAVRRAWATRELVGQPGTRRSHAGACTFHGQSPTPTWWVGLAVFIHE